MYVDGPPFFSLLPHTQGAEEIGIEIRRSDSILNDVDRSVDAANGLLAQLAHKIHFYGRNKPLDWCHVALFVLALFGVCWILFIY